MKVKCKVWPENVFLFRLTESVALLHQRAVMATVLWDAEEIVLIDYFEHCRTITETYYANLIGKVLTALKQMRREKLRRGCCFTMTTQRSCSSTDCHPKFPIPTALSPTAFTRFDHD